MKRLTQKQESFCINYFKIKNITQAAKLAKYSPKTAYIIGSENLKKPMILERLAQLEKKAEDAAVADVKERRQRLTQFIREDNYNKFGISRQSNIQAVDILNKMDSIYQSEDKSINVNVSQKVEAVEYRPADIAKAIIEAIRLELNPEVGGGNGKSETHPLLSTQADTQTDTIPKSTN